MRTAQVTFDLPDASSERPFLREYVVPAWDRFETHDAFESGWFWRFGSAGSRGPVELDTGRVVEEGFVVLVLNGDPSPEPVLAAERSRWDGLVDDGTVLDWEVAWFDPEYEHARAKALENFGAVGGDRTVRLRPLAARFTLDTLAEFDEQLPAVGESTDENPRPVGFWVVIHYLMKQQGFGWDEEIDACTKAIRNRLRSFAHFHGDDAAREELDALREEFAAMEQELGL